MGPTGVAIIGASRRSSVLYDYLRDVPDEGFVSGIYDAVGPKAEEQVRRFGDQSTIVYESLSQAVEDPRAAAVFVASIDCAHADGVVAALKAGKHVFCEKPMAITIEGCDRIIEAAASAPGIFYLGMNLRHGPVHQTMHDIVASGQLGRMLTIEANEHYHGGQSYFRRWNRLQAYSGGLWITKACHDFDLLNWFAGGRAKRVFAVSSLSVYRPRADAAGRCRDCALKTTCPDVYDIDHPSSPEGDRLKRMTEEATGQPRDMCLWNSDKDTFDNGMAVIEYDSDVRATYTLNVISAHRTRQLRLTGTEGFAEGDLASGQVTVRKRYRDDVVKHDLLDKMAGGHGGSDSLLLADFFRCCRTGDNPRTSWQEGRASVEVGLAARRSCDTGEVVHL